MRIESDTKLDFHNVLIRPKRTTLSSRSQVNVERTISRFPYSTLMWSGVPIIAANMDTTGTFDVYNELSKEGLITALNKHYTKEELEEFVNRPEYNSEYLMYSTGISSADLDKIISMEELIRNHFKWICVDIANGYMEKLVEFCQLIRSKFPDHIIVAGNVFIDLVLSLLIKAKSKSQTRKISHDGIMSKSNVLASFYSKSSPHHIHRIAQH